MECNFFVAGNRYVTVQNQFIFYFFTPASLHVPSSPTRASLK